MPTFANPPDGWTINTGTWGDDADGVNPGLSSGYALRLLSTAVATSVAQRQLATINPGLYRARASVRASSNAAGNTLLVRAQRYRAGSSTNYDLLAGLVSTINTWEHYSTYFLCDEPTVWVSLIFAKTANLYTADVGQFVLEKVPLWFNAFRSADQGALAASGWRQIYFNSDTDTDPAAAFNTGTYNFVAPYAGVFEFATSLSCSTTIADAKVYSVGIAVNGSIQAQNDYVLGAAHAPTGQCSTGPLVLASGDTVGAYVWHNHSADITVQSSSQYTWFRGKEVA